MANPKPSGLARLTSLIVHVSFVCMFVMVVEYVFSLLSSFVYIFRTCCVCVFFSGCVCVGMHYCTVVLSVTSCSSTITYTFIFLIFLFKQVLENIRD